LTPETPEEEQEREGSAWWKRWKSLAGCEGYRKAVQFFRGEGVTGIDFAVMTVREFGEFTMNKAWKYRFVSERDSYGYEVVKLYRRPLQEGKEDDL
jgi:hypothetical protein